MCDTADDGVGISNSVSEEERLKRVGLRSADLSELMPFARQLANARENRDSHIGFVGYNKTVAGNKVLIAVDREYDQAVPNAVAAALREKGAHVDILIADMGDPDREFDYLDEVEVIMRREPWDKNPRRWEGMPYIEDFALERRLRSADSWQGRTDSQDGFSLRTNSLAAAGAFPPALDDVSAGLASAHQQENLGPDLGVWERRASASNGCGGYGYFMDLLG